MFLVVQNSVIDIIDSLSTPGMKLNDILVFLLYLMTGILKKENALKLLLRDSCIIELMTTL